MVIYKLRSWVDEDVLVSDLSLNVNAVDYLKNHEHLINYYIYNNENAIELITKRFALKKTKRINYNKNAVNLLRNNPEFIDYSILCGQEHGIEFVDKLIENNELDKINWSGLSKNPAAMHILNDPKYYEYINWYGIIHNPNAVELLKNNLHMVDKYWYHICLQPHLIDIIKENMDKVNWMALSSNCNAIDILEKNMDKVHWECLAGNENAISILENNMQNIDISCLCNNKNGFRLLLRLGCRFNESMYYHENIIYEYFKYCEEQGLLSNICNTVNPEDLSKNAYIFEYDYNKMSETRRSLPWYNHIKNLYIV
jgi:hypothetical protein